MSVEKSTTDLHWENRSRTLADQTKVNIGDTVQREVEIDFILKCLTSPNAQALEVGCGNGHLTRVLRDHVGFIDAFDYSEGMIEQAKSYAGETNNRFFVDNVVELKTQKQYDLVVCVRVLINLRNVEEQIAAVQNIARVTKAGGRVILIEGFKDGFESLSKVRTAAGLPELVPAKINFYSHLEDLMPTINASFEVEQAFDSGTFDFLTRVVYPLLVGADKVREAGEFHQAMLPLATSFQPEGLRALGRLRGFCLKKR